jgi:eukaryotic-like serine/threonine-protein kinase
MAGPLTRAGRYEIVAELGRGSMGVVYQGFDPVIGRTVAIKTMLIEGLPSSEFEEFKQRFQREAQSAGILTHPNIVTVYDFGEDNGVLFLAMEYLEGKSIQQLVEKHNIMPVETLVPMYEQICSALDHAHQHKIVHRDIKPANIMILDSGLVKVTDFGIAKVMSMGMTQAGQILGTPNYMSPEQVKGRQVDGRSDIFSLGVILYELVTGEKPFGGQNITTVIYKIINEEPIPPRQLDATIHPGLSYVISKSLAKNPVERYQTCRELAEDLRNYKNLGGQGAPSATVVMRVPPIGAQPTETVQHQPPPPPQKSSLRVQAKPAQPAFDPQVAPYPQTPAPQPQRAAVPPPAFASVKPQRSSSSVAWAFIVVLLLAGAGGGAFYYYTQVYLPQQQAKQNSTPPVTQPTTQPSTEPATPTGGNPVAQNPNPATTTPDNNSTTPDTTPPGTNPTLPTNQEPTNPPPVTQPGPTHETPATVTPTVKNGTVTVTSNIRGGDITVDGGGTGLVTPHALELSAGNHVITVSKDGYKPTKVSVSVRAGRAVSKRIVLAEDIPAPKIPAVVTPPPVTTPEVSDSGPGQGSVTIETTPPGLPITIDGKPVGKSPTTILLPPGKHTYSFTCPYTDPQTKTLNVNAGAISTHTIHCTE